MPTVKPPLQNRRGVGPNLPQWPQYLSCLSLPSPYTNMASKKDSEPFYMSEVDSDVPVLPEGVELAPEDIPEDARFVEIGTIETNPKIS